LIWKKLGKPARKKAPQGAAPFKVLDGVQFDRVNGAV